MRKKPSRDSKSLLHHRYFNDWRVFMTIYKVLTFPHVLLKKKSTPVNDLNENVKIFCNNLVETMYAMEGIGLAAPQVGVLKRIIVLDINPYLKNPDLKEWAGNFNYKLNGVSQELSFPLMLVNPEITKSEGEIIFPYDGCLSFPGVSKGGTARLEKIWLTAKNVDGGLVEIECTGILSICIQHELDHLEGILFVERTGKKIDVLDIQEEIKEAENEKEFRKLMKKIKPVDAQKNAPKIF
jgi:peptide deformylase